MAPRIIILITTYNRAGLLLDLLRDIALLPCDYKVKIYNDGSTDDYSKVIDFLPQLKECEYTHTKINHSKRLFWDLHNLMYEDLRTEKFDYVIQLLDDMRLVPDFYPEVINQFEECRADLLNIIMPDCTLDFLVGYGAKKFAVNGYEFYDYNWNDLCYITVREYFEAINYSCPPIHPRRWTNNPNATSGVGSVLTNWFTDLGGKIAIVTKSLLIHTGKESRMNPHREGYISVL